MSLGIAGMGWVTPLGGDIEEVWRRLLNGDESAAGEVSGPPGESSYSAFRVPDAAMKNLAAHARLRRVSAISRFAAAAGLSAFADARLETNRATAERTALIFAISNGGVIYTKRFYNDIIETGAQSASPLLFPETVFNAPASHVAALLDVPGPTYTLVGDGAVGPLALHMADEVMQSREDIDYCLVVGAEEVDWLLCDAYHRWRLLRHEPPIETFGCAAKGTILSEGAGAILLAREGPIRVEKTSPGGFYRKRTEASALLTRILVDLRGDATAVIASANGTFTDAAEATAIRQSAREMIVYTAKPALGEGVGAAGLWQVIVAALALRHGTLPPVPHVAGSGVLQIAGDKTEFAGSEVVVLNCGLGQQASGVRLARAI